MDDTVSAEIVRNGPIKLRGQVKIKPSFSAEVETQTQVALCRCGLSKNTPYCDGSHHQGFKDEGLIQKNTFAKTRQAPAQSIDVICVEHGPLMCRGNVEMIETNGNKCTIIDPALCRCGASKRKPFCDGSHNKSGFKTA